MASSFSSLQAVEFCIIWPFWETNPVTILKKNSAAHMRVQEWCIQLLASPAARERKRSCRSHRAVPNAEFHLDLDQLTARIDCLLNPSFLCILPFPSIHVRPHSRTVIDTHVLSYCPQVVGHVAQMSNAPFRDEFSCLITLQLCTRSRKQHTSLGSSARCPSPYFCTWANQQSRTQVTEETHRVSGQGGQRWSRPEGGDVGCRQQPDDRVGRWENLCWEQCTRAS